MAQPLTHAPESESTAARRPRADGMVELPGGWLSERSTPEIAVPFEPDGLARFPSEATMPIPAATVLDEHVPAALVEPSERDRQRLRPSSASPGIALRRIAQAAGLVLATLAGGVVLAMVILGALSPTPSSQPTAGTANASAPASPAASVEQPRDDLRARDVAAAPAVDQNPLPQPTPAQRQPVDKLKVARTAATSSPSTPPSHAAAPALPSGTVTNWSTAVSSVSRTTSTEGLTPPPATTPKATVQPSSAPVLESAPPTMPITTPSPAAAPAPTETPAVPTSEATARAARETSIRSVLDRYRDAFDSLDADAVQGFWPSADRRALNRAFAQLESQRLQFDRCDIELAGARAFASCSGHAEYVRKAGSQDARFDPRQWTFTLGEVTGRWVILSVDARQVR